ncbi:MAG: thioredoxin [Proteobacteria bacterium]|nr:thioredoxin [Pseudomonadota bacterium]
MASGNVTDVTDGTFQDLVLKSEVPVLIDFWATWCAPCRAIGPHVQAVANEYEGKLKVVKVDIQTNMKTAMHFKVTNIPTLVVIKSGAEVARQQGTGSGLPGLKKLVEAHI